MSRERPSVLFLFADQLRGRDLGCMGNPVVRTPWIDQLAHEGVLARRCYANSPVCTPNRGTLLTGLFPHVHGAVANDVPMAADVPSIGRVMRSAGYRTGYVGKWHLDGVPRTKFTPPGNRRHGFDYWAAYNCAHDYFRPTYYRDSAEPILAGGYEPVVQTDLAVDFLGSVADDEAFVLFVSWGPPHDPYDQVPDEYRQRYDPRELTLAPNARTAIDNPLARDLDPHETLRSYYAAVSAIDDQVGRLLVELDRRGRRQDTIVVFTSDHGDMLWAHGMMKKQLPYEEAIHVSLVVRWPEQLPPHVHEAPCSTVDLVPTLLDMTGLSAPSRAHGTSLLPQLRGERGEDRPVLIMNQCRFDEALVQGVPEWRGLRTVRWTYAETLGREPWLLFDNDSDPWQLENLAGNPAYRDVQDALASELGTRLDAVADPFADTLHMVEYCHATEAWDAREAYMAANEEEQRRLGVLD
ncbi:sulfatase [Jiangella asiatica]|nr:sulfatase [Jiangella asiatica]